MSTTFAIIMSNKKGDKTRIDIAHRTSAGGGKVNIKWLNDLAPCIDKNTVVHAMNNTAQGVQYMGDLFTLDKYGDFKKVANYGGFNLNNDINNLDRDLIRIEKRNLTIEGQIKSLTEEQPNVKGEIEVLESLKENLSKTEKDCANINKTLDEYTAVSYLLKDSGIKSQVIKKYVPVFNTLINKYLQSMDFYVNFTLDDEFNEVIKSRFRDDFSYSSFSEGEKQKIDLALLFTWREVARMKNSASTNLLILDEVFDSSLDDSSTQELMKILRNLGQSTNVFVISHKGDILADKFMTTLRFEKINDFSKMIDVS